MEGELVVCFNLDGRVEELYSTLVALDSPLQHVTQLTPPFDDFSGSYLLKHRRLKLTNPITYGSSDYEVNDANPLHQQAREILGFREQSELIQEWDYSSPDAIAALQEIRAYLKSKQIGEYVYADWEMGGFLAGGLNPKTGKRMQNFRLDVLPL